MPNDRLELTKKQLDAIKEKLGKPLPADEAALLEGLVVMANTHPDQGLATAWHYMISTRRKPRRK